MCYCDELPVLDTCVVYFAILINLSFDDLDKEELDWRLFRRR
jgi:hypothetical protein